MKHLFKACIQVTLKPSLLDIEGEAILAAAKSLNFQAISSVKKGHWIQVELEAYDQAEAEKELDSLCKQLLSNPVTETYAVYWVN